jgi:hypothetical protein
MINQKLLQPVLTGALSLIFLVGCAAPVITPISKAPAQIIAPTSIPSLGTLKGKLLGADSQKVLGGAAIILCSVVDEQKCSLKAGLVTTVMEDGCFELVDIPPATYIVFFDPSGKATLSWKEIDGLEMILKLEGLARFPGTARDELFSTFGGNGAITIKKGFSLEFKEDGRFGGDGSVISDKYGLTMDFHEGKPIMAEIQPGKITEIEIQAVGL